MPDPAKKTVSASQIAALFDESPYDTRFSLYHKFRGVEVDDDESGRMSWGTKMQPLLLEQAAHDLALEVTPNEADAYVQNGVLGCTRDAIIHDPSRGPGSLETKCCFDYLQWMTRWGGGVPPRDLELQLQTQMLVGHEMMPYGWGVIACWLAGEMHYFHRDLDIDLGLELVKRAGDFLLDVDCGNEPDAFGSPVEDPILAKLYPKVDDEVVELDDVELGELCRMYDWAGGQESLGKKTRGQIKSKILDACKDHGRLKVPGAFVNITKSETKEQVATEVGQVIRKAGIRTVIKVDLVDEATVAPQEIGA